MFPSKISKLSRIRPQHSNWLWWSYFYKRDNHVCCKEVFGLTFYLNFRRPWYWQCFTGDSCPTALLFEAWRSTQGRPGLRLASWHGRQEILVKNTGIQKELCYKNNDTCSNTKLLSKLFKHKENTKLKRHKQTFHHFISERNINFQAN